MNNQNWFALEIDALSAAAEAVEFALNELDALGTEINNLGKKPQETLKIVGYFNEKPDDEVLQNNFNEALRIYGFAPDAILNYRWQTVENQDWIAEWKKHWKPTESEKFIIAPTWEKVENSGKIVIYIDPNMAFGTGTHATTQLCLDRIGELYAPEMTFLDVGTGTGILAIAAVKVQDLKFKIQDLSAANHFLACDTDEDSVKIARENAGLNSVADQIEFYVGSIDEQTPKYDFVCANLTIDVIVPILSLLISKTNQYLILSGILKEQESQIVEELKKYSIENPQIEVRGEWISVTLGARTFQFAGNN